MCDGIVDCIGEDDEKHCPLFPHMFHPSQICEIVLNASIFNFPWTCHKKHSADRPNQISCINLIANVNPLTFDFTIPSKPVHNDQNQTYEPCVYIPHVCGLMHGQSNGYHLISCEEHVCDKRHFKCPGYYCLPWRFVCNDQLDCPGGADEAQCAHAGCPGMFKCRNSSICISGEDLCDDISDCPLNDDQFFCNISNYLKSCPSNCSCLLYSFFCTGLHLKTEEKLEPYIYIYLHKMDLPLSIFVMLNDPVFLVLEHCGLKHICKMVKLPKQLRIFNISGNTLKKLEKDCFEFMSNITHLNMSKNRIASLSSYTFQSSSVIVMLDLSNNKISILNDKVFSGLYLMKVLNLIGNSIVSISNLAFFESSIEYLVTNKQDYKVCCVKPSAETLCYAKPNWPNTCNRLLGHSLVKILIWCIIVIGILMNIYSCIIIWRKLVSSGENYNNLVVLLSINDICYCISLLTKFIVIADDIFADDTTNCILSYL